MAFSGTETASAPLNTRSQDVLWTRQNIIIELVICVAALSIISCTNPDYDFWFQEFGIPDAQYKCFYSHHDVDVYFWRARAAEPFKSTEEVEAWTSKWRSRAELLGWEVTKSDVDALWFSMELPALEGRRALAVFKEFRIEFIGLSGVIYYGSTSVDSPTLDGGIQNAPQGRRIQTVMWPQFEEKVAAERHEFRTK